MDRERGAIPIDRSNPSVATLRRPEAGSVHVRPIGPDRRREWDAFVARSSSFALLQSWAWGDFKERSGWKAVRIAAEVGDRIVAGAQMLIKPALLGITSVAYVPRGPVGEWHDRRVSAPLLRELHGTARRHRAFVLRIEPADLNDSGGEHVLQRHGFRRSDYSNQPRATIVVDLEHGSDEALARMDRKTRSNIRYAERSGVAVRDGDVHDLSILHKLMQATGHRADFAPRNFDYYRNEWQALADAGRSKLLIASHQGEPIAVGFSAAFGDHAACLHAASSDRWRNLRSNHLLMWEAIRWAASEGCRTFDLWGIPDDVGLAVARGEPLPSAKTTDGLWGVYRFKRGFSEDVRFYAAAHEYVYLAPLRALMKRMPLSGMTLDRLAARLDAH